MPDISLRFHKDMLVLSAPLDAVLARQGIDVERDLEYLNLVEPEAIHDALRLETIAGAKCLTTNTPGITPARLTHHRMEGQLDTIVHEALATVRSLKPQHVLLEVGPCGLPLDAASAASLNECRAQYAAVARVAKGEALDALFLNGFDHLADLKCALMGVRQVLDIPVFASVNLGAEHCLSYGQATLEEALALMADYGASVVGFCTAAAPKEAAALVRRACATTTLPVLAQLRVGVYAPKQGAPTAENPYYCPDAMVEAAALLRQAGAQFLRAAGQATPAYTGALAAASDGFDVARMVEEG